jgi:hypothetical protein
MTPKGPSATGAQPSTTPKSGGATSNNIIVADRKSTERPA